MVALPRCLVAAVLGCRRIRRQVVAEIVKAVGDAVDDPPGHRARRA
ncbi:hypothetical protein [Kibdelosporangium philippinense]